MTDYFEELGFTPLADGERPNHFLLYARFLLEHGRFDENAQWPSLAPPASEEAITNLKSNAVTESDKQCPICLKRFKAGTHSTEMPCHHEFHATCIVPWLNRTNSCPLCRHELPTANENYEKFKKDKIRAEKRRVEIEELHNSMFS